MKKLILFINVLVICLAACSNQPTQPTQSTPTHAVNPSATDPTTPPAKHTYIICDLGICSDEEITLPQNARNPWDLTVSDGNVYVGTGDFGENTGPTSIWTFDSTLQKWTISATVDQEAIARFVNINEQVIALGVDPVGDPQFANSYILNNGEWQLYSQIEHALHVFDAEVYEGNIYYGLGSNGDFPAVIKFDSAAGKYLGIPLCKNGIDVISVISKTEILQNRRVYDLFTVNNKLFCAFTCTYTTGKVTIEFFEFKDGQFIFCQSFMASNMRMNNKLVKNQVIFNSDAVFNGNCYLSLGDLYLTNDFIQFNKIDIPYNACVTDLYVDDSSGKEQLFILATISNGVGYKNTIYTITDNQLAEVLTFDHAASALSFIKYDADFYVGLGGQDLACEDTGRILKITCY